MKAQGFDIMNMYGKQKIPFVFFVNYQKTDFIVKKLDEIEGDDLLFNLNGIAHDMGIAPHNSEPILNAQPIRFEEYERKFNKVQDALKKGDTYLLNLTFGTPITCNLSLDEIYYRAKALFKARLKNKWVFFSPERFVSIQNNKLSTFPMKGTINAAIENAEALILDNVKEQCEHNTIVDLLRNDISIIGTNTQVEKYRYISKIETANGDLLQVSSIISNTLEENWQHQIGTLLDKITPAGSISGAPKPRTTQLIAEIENTDRGFYTGIAGIFDGENLESGVMIRFIEQTDNGLVFRSGGGIHHLSKAEDEYNELIEKIYLPF